jgi:hypothetical protein
MALHRDIFWIGRQWAVTGHGMQLIDQRLEGAFDIEAARLWDDDLIASLRAKAWLKAEDFDKGLSVARTRQWPPHGASDVVPPIPAIEPIAPLLPAAKPETPNLEAPKPEWPVPARPSHAAEPLAPGNPPAVPAEPARQQSPELSMKTDGRARFARPWRVWMKGKT